MPGLSNTPIDQVPNWIKQYLTPNGARAHSAFQFTINGVTYPFVRNMHFAALPDPPRRRRYSMMGALYLTRPGDLMFFFQSDPQWRGDDIESRRGLRGIYRVIGNPFRGIDNIRDTTGYTLLGTCPNCQTFHATLRAECPLCHRPYPTMNVPSLDDPYHFLLLSLRLEIEPLIVFERAISDERCYADMTDTGMIWVGRHDNQMGAGKGSSVRQLLSEEAVKMTRMMISEPGQRISYPPRIPYCYAMGPIMNADGTNVTDFEVQRQRTSMVAAEHMLNFEVARTIDQAGSSIVNALGADFVINDIEYVSSEFPWGYTAGEADFIVSLARDGRRYRIFVMEFKRDWLDDDTVIQVSLYTRWVVQVMTQFANPAVTELEVVPIIIGRRISPGTARPHAFDFQASYNSGAQVTVHVQSPRCITYVPQNIFAHNGVRYAATLDFVDASARLPQFAWVPQAGIVTSQVERDWVKDNSWRIARQAANAAAVANPGGAANPAP